MLSARKAGLFSNDAFIDGVMERVQKEKPISIMELVKCIKKQDATKEIDAESIVKYVQQERIFWGRWSISYEP